MQCFARARLVPEGLDDLVYAFEDLAQLLHRDRL
jgi:hypothetical protein